MHNEGSCHKQQIGWPNCIREKLKDSNIVKKNIQPWLNCVFLKGPFYALFDHGMGVLKLAEDIFITGYIPG